MLLMSLLLSRVADVCTEISKTGLTTRLKTGDTSNCYTIVDSFFVGCAATDGGDKSGGALKITGKKGSATIQRCTFQGCWAKSGNILTNDMGGAVFIEKKELIMEDCCGSGCWCWEDGQFLYTRAKTEVTLTRVSVLLSVRENGKQMGTIYLNKGSSQARNINLTKNRAFQGCAICTGIYHTSASLSYLTIVGNDGDTVFHNVGYGTVIEYSNFLDNNAQTSTIYLSQYKLEIGFCVFRGNSNTDTHCDVTRSAVDLGSARVHDCLFDYELKKTDYLIIDNCTNDTTGNAATIKICHFDTQLCKVHLPCDYSAAFEMSSKFSPSNAFQSSSVFSATESFSHTNGFAETECFSPSSQLTQSSSFTANSAFNVSTSSSPRESSETDIGTDSGTLVATPEFTTAMLSISSSMDTQSSIGSLIRTRSWDSLYGTVSLTVTQTESEVETSARSEKKSHSAGSQTSSDHAIKSKSLSTGVIVGIIVAILVLVAVIIIVIIVVIVKHRRVKKSTTSPPETHTTEMDIESNPDTNTQWQSMTEINPLFADSMDMQMAPDDIFARNGENYEE